MKKETIGKCCLCGEIKKLSFEHVPPQSAFNNKPIFIQNHVNLFEKSSNLYGKKYRSHKGFGGYTLCEQCNNNTGDWYARDFSSFAHQGMDIIKKLEKPQYVIEGEYNIKPLNVIKQILTMFMSTDKSGHLQSQKDLITFILNKEQIIIPNRYKVFIYSTLSKNKRQFGPSIVWTEHGIQHWAEINFQPFGYLLAENSIAAHPDMADISKFGECRYDQEVLVKLTTAYLNVDSPFIGVYN